MRTVSAGGSLIGIVLAFVLGACSAPPPTPAPAAPVDDERFRLQAATREAARVVFAEGVYLREAGKSRRALQLFSDAVRLDPEDPALRLALTRQYLQLGAIQEAAGLLDQFAARFELSPDENLLAARLHVVAGRDSAAAVNLQAALAADSSMVDAWLLRGRLLLDAGQLPEALVSLQRAAQLEPYRAATHLRLADCHARMGEREQAEADYLKAIQFDPAMQAARAALATLYREDGRLDEAITVYQQVLLQEPNHEATISSLLELLLDTRRYEDASRLLAPRHRDAVLDQRQQYIYGWLLLQLGDLESAQSVLEPLSDLRGVDVLLGELAMRRDQPEQARKHFEAAVRKSPDECAAHVSLVGAMLRELRDESGRLDRSASQDSVRAVLSTASEVTPPDAYRCNLLLGIAYAQVRDFEAALPHLEATYALNPRDTDVLFNLAMAHQELGHFETALRYGRDVLVLEPENPAALNFVGYILAERGIELADSEEMIRRALAVEPENGYYVDSLGWLYYQRGQYEQAAFELERAVELTDNNDPIILEHLGDAYMKMGRLDGAFRVYEQSRGLAPSNDTLLDKIRELEKRLGKP